MFLHFLGIKAVHVTSLTDAKGSVTCNDYTHIFVSPELLEPIRTTLNELSSTSPLRNRIRFVFVDESHCIIKWYVIIPYTN